MRFAAAWTFAALLPALLSCDPCAGTIACSTDYEVRLTGTIVDHRNGKPLPGTVVSVDVVSAGTQSHVDATTDAGGVWFVSTRADCCSQFLARVVVTPPGQPGYAVPEFPVRQQDERGQATLLGIWADRPYRQYFATLLLGETTPLNGATVTFQSITGVPADPPTITTTADGIGNFQLLLTSDRVGSAIGTLTIDHPLLTQPIQLEGFAVTLSESFVLRSPIALYVYDEP